MIVSVVFTQTRKIKVSWKNKDWHSPSFWKWTSNKTLQWCRPDRERAYTTSEYNLINYGKNLVSFRSLQAFGKSAMPPTGWFWVYAFDMIFFFSQQFLIIFYILQCTFAYSRKNLVIPINSLHIMVLNIIRDQFSSTSVARSEKSRVLREIHIYVFCAIHLNTTLSTQMHNYPTCNKSDMFRIISRMILCRGWEVFNGSPFTHDK